MKEIIRDIYMYIVFKYIISDISIYYMIIYKCYIFVRASEAAPGTEVQISIALSS